MLQGYFDASGSKHQDRVISLAGFVTNSGKWTSFSEDWDRLLHEQHTAVFKMQVETKRRPEERNARIAEFVAMIRQHVLFKIECSINVSDFLGVVSEPINTVQAAWLPRRSHLVSLCKQLLDDCHFWIISNLVAAFGPGVWDRGFHHPFDLFFDEQLLEMSRAAPIFYEISKNLAPPRFRRILPDRLISRKDTEFPPLQAADLFAWIARRNYQQEVEGWEWLIAELDAIESMQCFFLDKARLTKQIGAFYEYILGLGPQFEDEQIKRWSKLIAA